MKKSNILEFFMKAEAVLGSVAQVNFLQNAFQFAEKEVGPEHSGLTEVGHTKRKLQF